MENSVKTSVIPNFADVCGCNHDAFCHANEDLSDYQHTGCCSECGCTGFHKLTPISKSVIDPDKMTNVIVSPKTAMILKLMFEELEKADQKYEHDKMSMKELKCSLATVKCELEELKRETKRKKRNMDMMSKESIQLLAMSFKFNRDVIFGDL